MNVAVIGGGVEGQAAARYWLAKGARVTICDQSEEIVVPTGAQATLGSNYLKGLNAYDLIVRSPGVKPRDLKTSTPITSGMKEFFEHCPARIIGVTGTKGKGTTSTLTAQILEQAGKRVWLGGNIGRSPLDFLNKVKASDVVVLELSSFQLMDLDISPHIAVCLMIVAEHMDWHGSLREYVAAKGNLFWHQKPGDIAIYNPSNDFSTQIALLSPGEKIPYLKAPGAYIDGDDIMMAGQLVSRVADVGLVGPHNLENICAALTAAYQIIGANLEAMQRAITEFTGLEHRLELVSERDDVSYYDDSFSTTPETAMAAIHSFEAPKVLILGGSDKKSKYDELGQAVARSNVRAVVVVGAMAERIRAALASAGYTHVRDGGSSMAEIVATARREAHSGDVVLLPPACASFDMFRNYKDRGDQFKAVVLGLGR